MKKYLLIISSFVIFFLNYETGFSEWNLLTQLNSPITKLFSDNSTLLIGAENNGLWGMDLKSMTLNQFPDSIIPHNSYVSDIIVDDDKSIIVSILGGNLLTYDKSADKWDNIEMAPEHNRVHSLSLSKNILYVLKENCTMVYKDNWKEPESQWNVVRISDLPFPVWTITSDNSYLYVGTQYGKLYKTTDFGNNWLEIKSNTFGFSISKIIVDKENIIVGTYGGGIFTSTDYGETWKPASVGLHC